MRVAFITPAVRDAATGIAIEVGPATADRASWKDYARSHPGRRSAGAKQMLGRQELRRDG